MPSTVFNPFVIGQTVTITGATTAAYNLTNATITAVAYNTFTVSSTATGATSTASAVSTTVQTGNLQEWQNASSTVLAKVDATGNFSASSVLANGQDLQIMDIMGAY